MKDGPISKLIITKTRHRATQYKKIIDTLPILCATKNYQGIADVIQNRINLVEADFTPIYPNTNLWLKTYKKEIISVNPAKMAHILSSSGWSNKCTFLTPISRNSYYRNSFRIPKSSPKNSLSLLLTRRP